MLKDCNFKYNYSTGYDEPKEFFTEALAESKTFDLGLGFFSSSAIRSLAYGFALFIYNGGKMRVVINHILDKKDKEAIERGQTEPIDDFQNKILSDIYKLSQTLSIENEQFFRCFSYLISVGRMEFIATLSRRGGISHDKYGIFTDENNNKVAFIGSANFSATALELNSETITTFTSWNDGKRVSDYQHLFEESWSGDTPHLIHIPMEKVKATINDLFPPKSALELLKDGIELRREHIDIKSKLSDALIEKLEKKEKEPHFPFPQERQIQIDAYKAWVDNDYKGIFAMATGSGKTVTALNCVLKQYHEVGFYKVIIVVPTQALALQWEQEARNFNFQNIISTHTNPNWKIELSQYITRSLYDNRKNIAIITTYATFNRKDIQYFISHTRGIESFIYIADEAHNLGSPTSLKHLPTEIDNRIGLSATPERIYDTIGSNQMYDFFNSRQPLYTYRFTMKDAIDNNILCHYNYFPLFIELTNTEMSEYERISNQLRKFIDPDTGKYKEEAERLLLKRKRIIHKAQNKKIAIANLLDKLKEENNLNYAFVFVPEGYEPDYAENETYSIQNDDIHIIDEYAEMFKQHKYKYHKYISGLDDAPEILKSFEDGDIQVLLSMKCLDEGVDIPRAEYAIFCSSTGNPRQFVQRRGRVLRKCKGKEKATIWDLIVTPPYVEKNTMTNERSLFIGEVKRIVNFATLADNKIEVLYGNTLRNICQVLSIPLLEMSEEEYNQYN